MFELKFKKFGFHFHFMKQQNCPKVVKIGTSINKILLRTVRNSVRSEETKNSR